MKYENLITDINYLENDIQMTAAKPEDKSNNLAFDQKVLLSLSKILEGEDVCTAIMYDQDMQKLIVDNYNAIIPALQKIAKFSLNNAQLSILDAGLDRNGIINALFAFDQNFMNDTTVQTLNYSLAEIQNANFSLNSPDLDDNNRQQWEQYRQQHEQICDQHINQYKLQLEEEVNIENIKKNIFNQVLDNGITYHDKILMTNNIQNSINELLMDPELNLNIQDRQILEEIRNNNVKYPHERDPAKRKTIIREYITNFAKLRASETIPDDIKKELLNSPIYQDALLYKVAKEKGIKIISLEGRNLEHTKETED